MELSGVLAFAHRGEHTGSSNHGTDPFGIEIEWKPLETKNGRKGGWTRSSPLGMKVAEVGFRPGMMTVIRGEPPEITDCQVEPIKGRLIGK